MNILLNSIPKSGTNLLQKCLELAGINWSGRSLAASSNFGRYGPVKNILRSPVMGEVPVSLGLDVPVNVSERWLRSYVRGAHGYISGHMAYSGHLYEILSSENFRIFQVIRHPCAIIASWANFIAEPGYYRGSIQKHMSRLSFDERVKLLVNGGYLERQYIAGIRDVFLRAQGWYEKQDRVLIVRFEDLVGSRGGGDDETQRSVLKAVFAHVGLEPDPSRVSDVQSRLFGGTHTFRKGNIDSWKDQITQDTEREVYHLLKGINGLEQLGYFSGLRG